MDWKTLLSTKKLIQEEEEPKSFGDYPINEFEKDYNRIVLNAAFRRLQDKTQVFPLEKNDFIRTRLTHSIEVSTVAKQLGIMISKNKTKYPPKDIKAEEADGIASVLLCAGLLHDLGNPPFGHFGETVIGDWFKENLDKIQYKGRPLRGWLDEQMIYDLENFEGNAQALRILLKARHGSGINLSFAIIGALVKYPNDSLSFDKKDPDIRKHKLGFYLAEQSEYEKIAEELRLKDHDGNICRHPLTYLLEAADDISYDTADLEDAFKKGLFTLDEFISFFEGKCEQEEKIKEKEEKSKEQEKRDTRYTRILLENLIERREANRAKAGDHKAFSEWLDFVRRWLMYVVVYSFSRSYEKIMSGTYPHDLFYNTYHSLTVEILKDIKEAYVFNSNDILKLELSAKTILSFLLDAFVRAVLYDGYEDKERGFVSSKADKKYLSIFSKTYKEDYNKAKTGDERADLYLRLLMVTDYISGMTDTYARTLYRELSGIE